MTLAKLTQFLLVYVTIQNFAFVPNRVEIAAGDTVVWVNRDPVKHTITALAPAFDAFDSDDLGGILGPYAQTWSHQFNVPGRYPYYCRHHPNMRGVVIVRSGSESEETTQ